MNIKFLKRQPQIEQRFVTIESVIPHVEIQDVVTLQWSGIFFQSLKIILMGNQVITGKILTA